MDQQFQITHINILFNPTQNKDNIPPKQARKAKLVRITRIIYLVARGKWTPKQLKDAMDVVERCITFLRGSNRFKNILLISSFNFTI